MKKAEELRLEVDILEKDIRDSIRKFYNENGMCDINVNVQMSFAENGIGEKKLVDIGVKVYVTV